MLRFHSFFKSKLYLASTDVHHWFRKFVYECFSQSYSCSTSFADFTFCNMLAYQLLFKISFDLQAGLNCCRNLVFRVMKVMTKKKATMLSPSIQSMLKIVMKW